MDAASLREDARQAREQGEGITMSIRDTEDLADLLDQKDREIAEARKALRDEFAMAALDGIISNVFYANDDHQAAFKAFCAQAYSMADLMMEARGK